MSLHNTTSAPVIRPMFESDRERVEASERVATGWTADVTKSGIVLAESIGPDDVDPFPFGMIAVQTNREVDVVSSIDVLSLKEAWEDEDRLREVQMRATETGEEGSAIEYNDAADEEGSATIGLGFRVEWEGDIYRGTVYATGYLAIYNGTAEQVVQFIEDDVLPFAETEGSSDFQVKKGQATLTESTEEDGADEADPEACLHCELDASTTTIETRDGMPLCVADADAYDRGMLTEADIRGESDGE